MGIHAITDRKKYMFLAKKPFSTVLLILLILTQFALFIIAANVGNYGGPNKLL
jgi:hypothetical protein